MMVARVFVSHANADRNLPDEIFRALSDRGHEVFLARDIRAGIRPGDLWRQRLHQELRAADAVVCVVTSAYNASPWCAYEVGIAHEVGSLLLPVRAEMSVISVLLDDRQHVDVATNPEWIGDLDAALRRLDDAGGLGGWTYGRSPFPGLAPFTRDMAGVFYGRDNELRRLSHRLRSLGERRLLLVVGASGCGKSSLVTAGLTARLAEEPGWVVVDPFLPGRDPTRKLALALVATAGRAGRQWSVDAIQQRLRDDTQALVALAEELLTLGGGPPRTRLLLVIDQGEELFTRSDPVDRQRLVTLLAAAIGGPVRVVIALRSEFQDQAFALPELRDITLHTFPVRPLAHDMLSIVITEPARRAGLRVSPELVSAMVADTERGEALPLLAFTLGELAKGKGRGDSLSAEHYAQLGGVRGALAQRADAVLDDAVVVSGLSREKVLGAMTELARLDEAGRRTRRRIDLDELASEAERRALQVFVDEHLLSTSSDSLGGPGVGVVHEALLTVWTPLDSAIREREAALLSEGQVEQAAREWKRGGPLWGPDRLTAAVTTLWGSFARFRAGQEPVVNLNRAGREFLTECHRRVELDRRRVRRRRERTTGVLALLLAVAVWQYFAARHAEKGAEQARDLTAARSLIAEADNRRPTDPILALRLGLAAKAIHSPKDGEPIDPHVDGEASVIQSLADDPTGVLLGGGPVSSVAFSPDGGLLVSSGADGMIRIWVRDPADGSFKPIAPIRGGPGAGGSVRFGSDRRVVVAFDAQGRPRGTWDVTRPDTPRPLSAVDLGALGPASGLDVVSSAGRLRATAVREHITLTDLGDASHPRPVGAPLAGHTSHILSMAFAPDGKILASGDYDGNIRLWRLDFLDSFRKGDLDGAACTKAGVGLEQTQWRTYVPDVAYRRTCPPAGHHG